MALAGLGVSGCHRPAPPTTQSHGEQASQTAAPEFADAPVETREGKALWYDVPDDSLAARRAAPGELTAASDKLPQQAYVRVMRLEPDKGTNPKPVVVRITDKGLGRRDALVEVDREAAKALGMVKDGEVRVRVEVLASKGKSPGK